MKRLENLLKGNSKYLFIVVIACAVALRVYHIDYQSLWLDELFSIVAADPQNSVASIIEYSKRDMPPLFPIYIHYAFKIFGYNEHVGRMASAFLGLLGILAVYLLGKECQGKSVGQFAAFLTVISYYHIYYSQELRFYTMVFLFSALSYLFFIRAFKGNRIIDFTWYTLFTIFLLYTHFYGIIIFSVQVLTFFLLLIFKRDSRFILYSLCSGALVILAFSPWIQVILRWSVIEKFWIETPSPYFIAEYFYDYTGKDAITTVLFLLFIFLFIKWYRSGQDISNEARHIGLIILSWIICSYLIPYVRSTVSTPMLQARYTIITLPAWFILLAIGWDKVQNGWRYILPLLLTFSFMVNMIFFKQHYVRLEKDQFREASGLVKSRNEFHYPVYSILPRHFNYYFRNEETKVNDLNEIYLLTGETFWLLQAHASEEEMNSEIESLGNDFDVVEKNEFFGANAILMKRKHTIGKTQFSILNCSPFGRCCQRPLLLTYR